MWGKGRAGKGDVVEMPDTIRRQYRTLSGRFVVILCVTFLPLGVLAVVVASAVVRISAQKVYDAYERELESAFDPLQERLFGVEERLDDFVLAHITELTSKSRNDEVLNYKMIKELETIHAMQQMEGVVYLFDRRRSSIYTKYNYETYTYAEMKAFQDKLLYRGYSEGTSNGWQLYYFDRKCFLRRSYAYEGYDIGFLLDVRQFLEGLERLEEWEAGEVYLNDGDKMMRVKDGECGHYRGGTWEDVLEPKGAYRMLLWEGAELGMGVAVKIPAFTLLQKVEGAFVLLLITLGLEIGFIFLFWNMVRKWVAEPIRQMNEALAFYREDSDRHYRITEIDEGVSVDFRGMYENFNKMAENIEEGKAMERQFHHMCLDNLKLRMNPHMLVNSFNLIYSMAQMKKYEGIQEFSLCLVDYFRYMLKETSSLVRVRDEMEFVHNYMRIQKIRFPERFNYVYDMEAGAQDALIPPLLIESFVENSVKYAMIPKKTTEILVNIRREGEWLFISVTDTGKGIKPEVMKDVRAGRKYVDSRGHEHIGIYNSRKWMEYYYHGRGRVRITSTFGAGTQVWIEVPYMEGEEGHEDTGRG